MKQKCLFFLLIAIVSFGGCQGQSNSSDSLPNKDLLKRAHQLIKEYNTGVTPANNVVKVVYFHTRNQKPLFNWRERLTRTLNDVSDFYKEEFYKYGVDIEGIPFEKSEGNIVFHVVEGDSILQNYDIRSGQRIQSEIYNKTKGQIDFSKDHVLIINGLSYQREDGVYVFNSPYHGMGSFSNGVCQVADCELLDSKSLKDSTQRMVFSEMMIKRKECSVAEFNSWYVGGIAHEMGHIFGLPHDYGHPTEFESSGISLMGQYGSRHYREYLWGGKISSFFSAASILQLISHPIFAKSSKSNNIRKNLNLPGLEIENKSNTIILKTNVGFEERPYGVVALIRPSFQSEYFNRSFYNIVSAEDNVYIKTGKFSKGNYNLLLLYLFPNGTVRGLNKMINVDTSEHATLLDFPMNGIVDKQKLYEKLQMMEKTQEVNTKLEILSGILNPPAPIDPKAYGGDRLILSDAQWEKASVGWDKVARNYFNSDSELRFFLELHGKLYRNGLYAHSPSSFVFDLDKKWKTFSAIVGLRDYAHIQGSAKFTVIGDGKVLYESPALRTNQKDSMNVDISNVKTMELKADGTEGHNFNSWAIWVNPSIER